MKYPNIITVDSVLSNPVKAGIKVGINMTKYVPARPQGYPSFLHRVKAAWLVFTGKADALKWEAQ